MTTLPYYRKMPDLLEHPGDLPAAAQARLSLHIPTPKTLTTKEELAIATKAHERNPASLPLLYARASLLVRLDRFQEAAALLESIDTPDYRRLMHLFMAYIGCETEAGTLLARKAAAQAAEIASTPKHRAAALADLAKTYTRFGDTAKSEELLLQALSLDPHNKDAYKRLSRLYLNRNPEQALQLAHDMIARGVLHSRVLGSVPLILARMGRFEEAHAAEALDTFLLSKTPQPPPGWGSLAAFNDALAAEVLAHPDMRYERYGTASSKTWRVDEPALHRSRVLPQLQQLIRREVLSFLDSILDSDHPLARACPSQAKLRNWCVVTQGEGHETWHVHQNGWMSGVYYIHVQDHITHGKGPEGCLVFGISDEIAGAEACTGYGERLVRPHTGLLMMFPSHSFHKTHPHLGDGQRICFAFDIIPTDGDE